MPLSTVEIIGKNIPVAGGGYFRLFPSRWFRYLCKRLNGEGKSVIFYLHPWELDHEQPRMNIRRSSPIRISAGVSLSSEPGGSCGARTGCKMKITLLGTGDAIGTPKIGCSCPQSRYALQHGLQRLRTSFLIRNEEQALLIDSSPDLRQQLLRAGSPGINAVLWTHGHYDHFMGFGEFYRVQNIPDTYGATGVLDYCRSFFSFLPFTTHPVEPFRPFRLCGFDTVLFPVSHPPC